MSCQLQQSGLNEHMTTLHILCPYPTFDEVPCHLHVSCLSGCKGQTVLMPLRVWATCVEQGLWSSWYGSHGPEIVHVWFEDSVQSPGGAPVVEEPDHLPRPRLVGCKVTGDPNVPANQWTWEAQV